jgi:hypothetical protein
LMVVNPILLRCTTIAIFSLPEGACWQHSNITHPGFLHEPQKEFLDLCGFSENPITVHLRNLNVWMKLSVCNCILVYACMYKIKEWNAFSVFLIQHW